MTDADDPRIAQVERGLRRQLRNGDDGARFSIDERLAYYNVPGVSVAVLDSGRIVWARGWGVRDADSGGAVRPDTLFQAASISKPVAAIGAMRLVERGLLDLDSDVNDQLTSWKIPPVGDWQPRVTLRQLLSHSAGLTVHGFRGYRRDRDLPSLVAILDGTPPANSPPVRVDTLPGTQFRYSGGGTTVAQLLIEDVTGEPFAEYMRREVLAPAGMSASGYWTPLPRERWDAAATAHRPGGGPVDGKWHAYPELAAAALWTTPSDLLRLAANVQRTLAGEQGGLLAPETVREMLSPQVEPLIGIGFFLAGAGAAARFGHTGGNEGFRCELVAFREGGRGAAIMTNSDDGDALYAEVLDAVARAYDWPDYPRAERVPLTEQPSDQERFVGVYELRPDVLLRVTLADGALHVASAEGPPLPLVALDARTFAASGLAAQLEFVEDGLLFRQNEREERATRR